MIKQIRLPVVESSIEINELRKKVRKFIDEELRTNSFQPNCDAWMSDFSPEFSKKIANKGWLGVTVPREYGGKSGTNLDRYVITEELLAAGAPVAAHWVTDRQIVPLLLRFGTKDQKKAFLPKICNGDLFFSIGLSEPNSGSDLASLVTEAVKKERKYIINGKKTWINGAHLSHYMTILCRTNAKNEENKYEGFSQIMVDLSLPGVTVTPIKGMAGEDLFYEVSFEDVSVSENMLLGREGDGWNQCMAELSYERSGPERFLSTLPLLETLINMLRGSQDYQHKIEVGRLVAQLWTLRKMSLGVTYLLESGESPNSVASLVKDIGSGFEKDIVEVAHLLKESNSSIDSEDIYEVQMARAILHGPVFTLRGGTTEILRSIVSKELGVG